MFDKIMLDLETLGTGSNAAIVAIGAVAMDFSQKAVHTTRFYVVIDEADARTNGDVDESTVKWWSTQGVEARRIFDDPDVARITSLQAIGMFADWVRMHGGNGRKGEMWGNGADFDNVILMNLYRRLGFQQPWGLYNNRCYRTLKSLYPDFKAVRTGTHHNAVDDAETQAKHLFEILTKLGR